MSGMPSEFCTCLFWIRKASNGDGRFYTVTAIVAPAIVSTVAKFSLRAWTEYAVQPDQQTALSVSVVYPPAVWSTVCRITNKCCKGNADNFNIILAMISVNVISKDNWNRLICTYYQCPRRAMRIVKATVKGKRPQRERHQRRWINIIECRRCMGKRWEEPMERTGVRSVHGPSGQTSRNGSHNSI